VSGSYTGFDYTGIEKVEYLGYFAPQSGSAVFGDTVNILTLYANNLTMQVVSIYTGSANDEISFSPSPNFNKAYIYSGAGDDKVVGGHYIEAGAGNDSLSGVTMLGGTGNDTYVVDSMNDVVTELAGEGTDEVRVSVGSRRNSEGIYVLPAHVENLTGTSTTGQDVQANSLDNIVTMGSGGDLVVLDNGGNDQVSGGGGNDYLYWGAAFTNADSADGGEGYDTFALVGTYSLAFDANDLVGFEKLTVFSSGNTAQPASYALTMHDAAVAAGQQLSVVGLSLTSAETLTFDGSAELDGGFMIRSGAGADSLTGGAKRDDIDGGAGNDIIHGGGGKDSISGGIGADQLWGDAGADRFLYTGAGQSNLNAGQDWIRDFEGGVDKINLRGFDANGDPADGITAFSYIGSDAFTGQAGQLRTLYNGGAAIIEADINGDGAADFTIQVTVSNLMPLTWSDFEI
jgi:Ca2+-binding RTX toxin-like protein